MESSLCDISLLKDFYFQRKVILIKVLVKLFQIRTQLLKK